MDSILISTRDRRGEIVHSVTFKSVLPLSICNRCAALVLDIMYPDHARACTAEDPPGF